MKPTIPLFVCMFVCVLAAGTVFAQDPSIIQNTRATMNAVHDKEAAQSNEALGNLGMPNPAPGATSGNTGVSQNVAPASAKAHVTTKAHAATKAHGTATVLASAKVQATAKVPVPVAVKTETNTRDEDAASATSVAANGKRDPFVSPVVSSGATSSSCSNGKKCLEIGTINLKGIIKSENGFIAVVSNSVNKAYFLRENDPVFNGYVVRITGDSIVFQETLQDRLGKTFTREIVKKITTPAV
jgi:Tfp pilus assembly protein PilP